MSATYTTLLHTQYPDTVDMQQKTSNYDFSEKTDYKDYVHALEFNSVKDAVIAIEQTMGVLPQKTFGTISARIAWLEQFNTDFYDNRYGGAGWKNIKDANGNLIAPTILSHQHAGGPNAPSQIDLQAHVTGKLKRSNILLTGSGALAAAYIQLDESNTTTVTSALNSKLNISGGTITGNLNIQGTTTATGPLVTTSFFEAWTANMTAGQSVIASRSDAWGGSAYKNSITSGDDTYGILCSANCNTLRYNRYAVTFRLLAESALNSGDIRLVITEQGKSPYIYNIPSVTPNVWQSLSVSFDHSNCTNNAITFALQYKKSITSYVYSDGLSIMPIHMAITG